MRYKAKFRSDCSGVPLRVGDEVRVCGVPDLSGMSEEGIKESLPAFRFAVGKKFRIRAFDRYGFVEIDLVIPFGEHRGWHGIVIEPYLTRKISKRRT